MTTFAKTEYLVNRMWSDRFNPEIMNILRRILSPIRLATIEEDTKQNTDLVMMQADKTTISCRMRRYIYLHMFGDQFTFRKTEIPKLLEGYGDVFFYGFSDLYGHNIERWAMLDMDRLRRLLRDGDLKPFEAKRTGTGARTFWFSGLSMYPCLFSAPRAQNFWSGWTVLFTRCPGRIPT
jgi:hypothetical protein